MNKVKKGIVVLSILFIYGTVSVSEASAYSQTIDKGINSTQTIPDVQFYGASTSKKNAKTQKISKTMRNRYFSDSAFVGNSVSVGLKMYFNSQGNGFLGRPVMLVQGCYSFANDKASYSQYQITYKGRKYKAKNAVKAAGVKRVFISMGTNDLWKPASQTYRDYVQYIKGIRKENLKVVIFIQSTTPMCSSRCRGYLNNSAINELNRRMKNYCQKHKDMYYVDVSKGLKNPDGGLKGQYASDGYVHLTMKAYEIWTNNLVKYVDNLILQEQEASKTVSKAAKSKTSEDYQEARKVVNKLDNSTRKDGLKKKLKKIYVVETTTENE